MDTKVKTKLALNQCIETERLVWSMLTGLLDFHGLTPLLFVVGLLEGKMRMILADAPMTQAMYDDWVDHVREFYLDRLEQDESSV